MKSKPSLVSSLMLCVAVVAGLAVDARADTDLRKDPASRTVAGEAMVYIHKEGARLAKGATEKATAELKKVCTATLHKGCYFSKKSGEIMFQPLDDKGAKDGKIYDLKGWLKRLFA